MKVLVLVKATPNSEKGIVPDESFKEMFEAMGKYNEQLIKAGIMKEADGLKPSSAGKRITLSDDGSTSVIDGPFTPAGELVAGYWIWEVKSMDEAVSWAKRCPNTMPGENGVLELRPANTMEDFGELMTEEARAQDAKLRKMAKGGQSRRKAGPAAKRAPAKRAPARKKTKAKRAKAKK
jgi:hypothetical protein